MEIRLAEIKDIPDISCLLYQVHDVHATGRPDLFIKGAKKYTDEEVEKIIRNKETPIIVAVENEKVIGYAFTIFQKQTAPSMTKITSLYIDDLCVDKDIRGKGIGRKIFEYVKEYAKKNGCYNVTLNVWKLNESAMKFYEKCGLSVLKIGMEQIL